MPATANKGREARVLARPLVVAGELRQPGETVRLTPAQIDRLEPEGYFEKAPRRAKTDTKRQEEPEP